MLIQLLLTFNFFINLHLPLIFDSTISTFKFTLDFLPLSTTCCRVSSSSAPASLGFLLPAPHHYFDMKNLMNFSLFSPKLPVCTSLAAPTQCWYNISGISTSSMHQSMNREFANPILSAINVNGLPKPALHVRALKSRFSSGVFANFLLSDDHWHASDIHPYPSSWKTPQKKRCGKTHIAQRDNKNTPEKP